MQARGDFTVISFNFKGAYSSTVNNMSNKHGYIPVYINISGTRVRMWKEKGFKNVILLVHDKFVLRIL